MKDIETNKPSDGLVERVVETVRRDLVPAAVAETPEWRAVTTAAAGRNYRVLPVALEVLASHCHASLTAGAHNLVAKIADALRHNRSAEINAVLALVERKYSVAA